MDKIPEQKALPLEGAEDLTKIYKRKKKIKSSGQKSSSPLQKHTPLSTNDSLDKNYTELPKMEIGLIKHLKSFFPNLNEVINFDTEIALEEKNGEIIIFLTYNVMDFLSNNKKSFKIFFRNKLFNNKKITEETSTDTETAFFHYETMTEDMLRKRKDVFDKEKLANEEVLRSEKPKRESISPRKHRKVPRADYKILAAGDGKDYDDD